MEFHLMDTEAFTEVAWREVYNAMQDLPRLFHIWAYKQVTEISGTNKMQDIRIPSSDRDCLSRPTRLHKHSSVVV